MVIPLALFATKERFPKVPQANEIERIPEIIKLVGQGVRHPEDIARKMRFNSRQSAYYREAAEVLGFLNPRKHYSLTTLGTQFFASDDSIKIRLMICALLRNSIISCTISCLLSGVVKSVSLHDVEDLLKTLSNLQLATIQRRATTIMAWLRWLGKNGGIIETVGDRVRLKNSPCTIHC